MDFFHQNPNVGVKVNICEKSTAYHRDQHAGIASSAQTFPSRILKPPDIQRSLFGICDWVLH